jgi:hypothetical protein
MRTTRKPLPNNEMNQLLRGAPEKVSTYKMAIDDHHHLLSRVLSASQEGSHSGQDDWLHQLRCITATEALQGIKSLFLGFLTHASHSLNCRTKDELYQFYKPWKQPAIYCGTLSTTHLYKTLVGTSIDS